MSTLLWIMFAAIYMGALVALGLATLLQGRCRLFAKGIFFPLLWIVGAPRVPTPRAADAAQV